MSLKQDSMPPHHPWRPLLDPVTIRLVCKHGHEDILSRRIGCEDDLADACMRGLSFRSS
jgi:hypothetical protein